MTVEAQSSAVYPPPERLVTPDGREKPWVSSMAQYEELYKESLEKPTEFWTRMASETLTWIKPFSQVTQGSLKDGNMAWFPDGQLNVSYNCVDRWAAQDPGRVAFVYEADEPGQASQVTYGELLDRVCGVANVLHSFGLRKGDTVAIYMPMIPEAAVAMLACARLGLVHTVVFAGFSSSSLAERVIDARARVVITADEGLRGGRPIATKKIVDEALQSCPEVEKVLVYRRTGSESVAFSAPRDVWWHEAVAEQRPYCPPVPVSAEDPLFLLYTSGSTGKPKGVVHTSGGYLLGAALTLKYVFDIHNNDVFCCTADIGWITGHSYVVYGPLALGSTSVIFESVPTYPDASRYWQLVQDHKITQFYTAPTAIRALRRHGDEYVKRCDLSSLRVIGSVGEPINPDAWTWYNDVVGGGRCAVVDTYWQTETGSHVISPLPGATPAKPGSATFPFFGIELAILDPTTGAELEGNDVSGVLAIRRPWPSMARTIAGNHKRFLDTYLNPYPGYYFAGDGASRDADGYYWIRGRVDDVINVSGHRMSTAEIESALIGHHAVAESAVVGAPDDLTGQAICAFVTLKDGFEANDELKTELVKEVRARIGPIATPKTLILVDELPKTRSGKIIRRILRKVVAGEADQLGDVSTLSDPTILDTLVRVVTAALKK
ncbi:acetyl-coenzyme A synthetase 2 [Coemansia sp. RSA 989]|nr:acetyl-coenzyme A synthetase [Coemansia mojavensis]KAJ1739165.1 acetyl-coenzyme A synthetase 2 [Coemansia sp. RSA 1086]KAJ1747534.1 acetyl-coenzyme A synthetase 2 [Coemansia sp. RSA 1821]KAJ1861542.1 acetyl-coenzyme A synthetase 2 [Coemansia sp. RSA 989]KAJ1869324.1 acetyl-coenzyme A synthetase 2 [Coemansia sp. RSA 990]KAJ2667823.1 acetyl-coenzyme A synthetase 2 [Coemansia sp. RSA 1085]